MSIPEPSPINKGKEVPAELIKFIQLKPNLAQAGKKILIELISERDEFGKEKYGQSLMSQDGRNEIEDARQELGDFLQYVYKAKMNNHPDLIKLQELLLFSNILLAYIFKKN